MTDKSQFSGLVDRYILGEITPEENLLLAVMLEQPEYFDLLDEHMKERFEAELLRERDAFPNEKQLQLLGERLNIQLSPQTAEHGRDVVTPVRRLPFIRRWSWVAAAVVLVFIAGTYFWIANKKESLTTVKIAKTTGIPGGKEGAILTLSDGRQVVLDSLKNGVVATQNGTEVLLKDGQLAYTPSTEKANAVVYNTMTTPRGRQFELTLPDGTKVGLNAASSIRYPTSFTGKLRQVEITGEVYFEVAKNAEMPFHVNVNNKAEIEVLGTHFNVNAYDDEPCINTTLLEGSVRVINGQQTAILKPGQQASITVEGMRVIDEPDIEVTMSWRSPMFHFNFTKLDAVLRQLSRWYDVEVVYEKNVPVMEIRGWIGKELNLSDALDVLTKMGAHLKIEDRKIIVMP